MPQGGLTALRRIGVVGRAVLAVMALGAGPVANANTADFFAATQAAGVTGVGPAILENGYNVCPEIWNGVYIGHGAVVVLQHEKSRSHS